MHNFKRAVADTCVFQVTLPSGHVGLGRGRGQQKHLPRAVSFPAVPRAVAEIKVLNPVSFTGVGKQTGVKMYSSEGKNCTDVVVS